MKLSSWIEYLNGDFKSTERTLLKDDFNIFAMLIDLCTLCSIQIDRIV